MTVSPGNSPDPNSPDPTNDVDTHPAYGSPPEESAFPRTAFNTANSSYGTLHSGASDSTEYGTDDAITGDHRWRKHPRRTRKTSPAPRLSKETQSAQQSTKTRSPANSSSKPTGPSKKKEVKKPGFGSFFGAAVVLAMGIVILGFAAAAFIGVNFGTTGTFTPEKVKCVSGKSGTTCTWRGTFTSDDGKYVGVHTRIEDSLGANDDRAKTPPPKTGAKYLPVVNRTYVASVWSWIPDTIFGIIGGALGWGMLWGCIRDLKKPAEPNAPPST